eukprot:1159484-Pelagomonas_calceolata.AAC.3
MLRCPAFSIRLVGPFLTRFDCTDGFAYKSNDKGAFHDVLHQEKKLMTAALLTHCACTRPNPHMALPLIRGKDTHCERFISRGLFSTPVPYEKGFYFLYYLQFRQSVCPTRKQKERTMPAKGTLP